MQQLAVSTEDKIKEAAKELFWLHNYGSVSVDLICKTAGVKKGSFYHFYDSKADLCVACLDCHWKERSKELSLVFSTPTPVLERIALYADNVYKNQVKLKEEYGVVLGCPISLTGIELSNDDGKIRKKVIKIFDENYRYFESIVKDANAEGLTDIKKTGLTARQIVSYIIGLLYQTKIYNDTEVIKNELQRGILTLMEIKKK